MNTLLSKDRVDSVLTFAEMTQSIPGSVAELGVYEGGMVALLAGQCRGKEIYAIDTFTGTPESKVTSGVDGHGAGEFKPSDTRQIIATLKAFSNVRVVQGVFPEVMIHAGEGLSFSLVHIDADIYKTTKDALEYFWPRMSPGGVIVLDDWEWTHCRGVKRAADEFFAKIGIMPCISPATAGSPVKQAFVVKHGPIVRAEVRPRDPSGIVFVTLFDEPMASVGMQAIQSAEDYCGRWGYRIRHYSNLVDQNKVPQWNKLCAVLDVMKTEPDGQWVFWFDADMLFSDSSKNAFELISQGGTGKDFVFSQDWNGLCAGAFAVCNCRSARAIVESVLELGDVADPDKYGAGLGCKWEQNSFKELAASFPKFQSRVGFFNKGEVNDNPTHDVDPSAQFFLHYSCRSNEQRAAEMQRRLMWMKLKQESR